jgi:hypothetical protein
MLTPNFHTMMMALHPQNGGPKRHDPSITHRCHDQNKSFMSGCELPSAESQRTVNAALQSLNEQSGTSPSLSSGSVQHIFHGRAITIF